MKPAIWATAAVLLIAFAACNDDPLDPSPPAEPRFAGYWTITYGAIAQGHMFFREEVSGIEMHRTGDSLHCTYPMKLRTEVVSDYTVYWRGQIKNDSVVEYAIRWVDSSGYEEPELPFTATYFGDGVVFVTDSQAYTDEQGDTTLTFWYHGEKAP